MAWTRSACPCLKSRGQQLTKSGKTENCKLYSLLFRGYKHQQLKGEVSSLKCSLFRQQESVPTDSIAVWNFRRAGTDSEPVVFWSGIGKRVEREGWFHPKTSSSRMARPVFFLAQSKKKTEKFYKVNSIC